MKTKNLFNVLLLLLCSSCFMSCNNYLLDEKSKNGEGEKEVNEYWYDSIPGGNSFSRGNTLRFYYIDKNGKGLIDPNDPSTYPVSWWEAVEKPIERTKDYYKIPGLYNGNHNGITYDEEEDIYYFTLSAYGDEKQSTYSFPVYVNGDVDTMDITYKYTDKDVIGGKYWGKIVSWKYNGTHVYSDDDEHDKKVFIRKSDGKTTVSFTR